MGISGDSSSAWLAIGVAGGTWHSDTFDAAAHSTSSCQVVGLACADVDAVGYDDDADDDVVVVADGTANSDDIVADAMMAPFL